MPLEVRRKLVESELKTPEQLRFVTSLHGVVRGQPVQDPRHSAAKVAFEFVTKSKSQSKDGGLCFPFSVDTQAHLFLIL